MHSRWKIFRIELHVRTNRANGLNDLLHQLKLFQSPGVSPAFTCFGITLQRNRLRSSTLRQLMPKLFGEKGHYGMKQPQRRFECGKKILPGNRGPLAIRARQFRFDPLDIPVAKIIPEKLVDTLHRFVKALRFERILHRVQSGG